MGGFDYLCRESFVSLPFVTAGIPEEAQFVFFSSLFSPLGGRFLRLHGWAGKGVLLLVDLVAGIRFMIDHSSSVTLDPVEISRVE